MLRNVCIFAHTKICNKLLIDRLMSTIKDLAPQELWRNFYSLTQIPRPSGHTKQVSDFLVAFGKDLGLESFVDNAGNVVGVDHQDSLALAGNGVAHVASVEGSEL